MIILRFSNSKKRKKAMSMNNQNVKSLLTKNKKRSIFTPETQKLDSKDLL
jgi:hypothetical protein